MLRTQIDITLVVNVHAGVDYLRRTMLSLEEASCFATSYGIRCELLFVMDRSPPEALNWVRAYRCEAFVTTRIIEVSNGSLGLSRNDGLLAAAGEIVLFCDEDDLVSYNIVSECYFLAKAEGPTAVVVPEYFVVFCDKFYIQRYFGSGIYSPLLFIADHPFTSRICIHSSVRESVLYSDVRLNEGFAYEDYHFNSKLVALGFTFVAAPSTIIFYRQRRLGLQQRMYSISTNQIPPTPLFEPPTYLKVCATDYIQRDTLSELHEQMRPKGAEFFSDAACLEFMRAANAIDPGINITHLSSAAKGTNVGTSLAPGIAYYRACKDICDLTFTDVVLFPFITKGGGEKYILNVLDAIQNIDASARFLLLVGNRWQQHSWLDRLPRNSVFIDIPSLCSNLTDENIDVITLRLISSTAPSARVHLKGSQYVYRFIEKFGRLLTKNKLIYYRFCDNRVSINGSLQTWGTSFDFVSEHGSKLHRIVTDHKRMLEHDTTRLDTETAKTKLIYTSIQTVITLDQILKRNPTFRRKLIWTARLDKQKRPELLCRIAAELRKLHPEIRIDVYGAPTLDAFDITKFNDHSNIKYFGEYDGFETLPHDEYDALIYTTAFEGMPLSVLDALSAGLPVIAPDIGGIDEVVIDGSTGFLIPNSINDVDDVKLVQSYVAAIDRLYANADRFLQLRCNALKLVGEMHSSETFIEQVSNIFELGGGRRLQISQRVDMPAHE